MKRVYKINLGAALLLTSLALAAAPTTSETTTSVTTTSAAPAAAAPKESTTVTTTTSTTYGGGPIGMQAKMFTKDQLANALQSVVDKINACNGDTNCLKAVKEWNEAAMDSVKKLAVTFPAGQALQLELLCGDSKAPKISPENVTVDDKSIFIVNPPAKDCLVKGVNPKCGAIEHGKHYPKAEFGETLYCVTGDDAKLKQATENLKAAVMNSMKKAMQNSLQSKTPSAAPAAPAAPTTTTTTTTTTAN